jgi:Flp pilus assembly protein TadD
MMAERFLYVTLAGVLPLALGALFKGRGRVPRTAAILVFVLLGGAFVVVDRQRTEIWRDNTVFFDTLAERLPDDPSTQVRQAQQELRRGDAAEAAARLEGVVQRGIVSPFAKDRASLHYWYGRALLESGRSMEAVSQFELAGRHWPDREVTLALAEALAMSGRLARATEVLVAYLPDNPRDDTAWNALGNVQWLSGDRPGAAESYRKALKINPDNVEAATNLDRLGG